jgi:hypothetical protein
MITNGRVTAKGLQPYLVLLSIYQTCVYKKVNFLRFLLSGNQDVDAFGVASRTRRASVQRPVPAGTSEAEGVIAPSPVGAKSDIAGSATSGLTSALQQRPGAVGDGFPPPTCG